MAEKGTPPSFRTRVMSVFKLKPKDPKDLQDALRVVFLKFPRISVMIDACWGSPELHKKLTEMLQVDNVKREGFPPDVAEALMTIQEWHMDEFKFEPFANSLFFDSKIPDHW
jgi:hypothetical protein